jgi:hypothetical protein
MTYDLLRSGLPSDFDASGLCLASGQAATQATDAAVPSVGGGFFYLVRARNVCGAGVAHLGSSGAPVPARDCP